jgi:hypothetical protein
VDTSTEFFSTSSTLDSTEWSVLGQVEHQLPHIHIIESVTALGESAHTPQGPTYEDEHEDGDEEDQTESSYDLSATEPQVSPEKYIPSSSALNASASSVISKSGDRVSPPPALQASSTITSSFGVQKSIPPALQVSPDYVQPGAIHMSMTTEGQHGSDAEIVAVEPVGERQRRGTILVEARLVESAEMQSTEWQSFSRRSRSIVRAVPVSMNTLWQRNKKHVVCYSLLVTIIFVLAGIGLYLGLT